MDLDLDLKNPCHVELPMSGYVLLMDDMSPDGLWDNDQQSQEDGCYEG